mgnify:CR=1 FL=1
MDWMALAGTALWPRLIFMSRKGNPLALIPHRPRNPPLPPLLPNQIAILQVCLNIALPNFHTKDGAPEEGMGPLEIMPLLPETDSSVKKNLQHLPQPPLDPRNGFSHFQAKELVQAPLDLWSSARQIEPRLENNAPHLLLPSFFVPRRMRHN